MTDKKPPPASSSFAWNRAKRVMWLSATARSAPDWPDAFAVIDLARLQFPYEGTDAEKKRARRDQAALIQTINETIAAGTLKAEAHSRTIEPPPNDARLFRPIPLPGWHGFGSLEEWRERDRPPRRPAKPASPSVETWHTIERAAFRDFLASAGIEPSEHIGAWLRPLEQAEVGHEGQEADYLKHSPLIGA